TLSQTRRRQRPLVARLDERVDRRRDGRGRLDADARDHRQHAAVSPCARATSGDSLSCRGIARGHLSADLQAGLARYDAKFLPDVMPRALNVAQTGRPGAVLLDVPMDVFS